MKLKDADFQYSGILKNILPRNNEFNVLVVSENQVDSQNRILDNLFQSTKFTIICITHDCKKVYNNHKIVRWVDLILFDMGGGDKDAVDRIHIIKQKFPGVPVIVLTSHAYASLISRIFILGVDGFLTYAEGPVKIESKLYAFLKKGIPALSHQALPVMVQLLKGPQNNQIGFQSLSEIQKSIANLLIKGLSYAEISLFLQIGLDTVRYHIKQIYSKLNINKRIQLIQFVSH